MIVSSLDFIDILVYENEMRITLNIYVGLWIIQNRASCRGF